MLCPRGQLPLSSGLGIYNQSMKIIQPYLLFVPQVPKLDKLSYNRPKMSNAYHLIQTLPVPAIVTRCSSLIKIAIFSGFS